MKVHFIGIGGISMSGLASICLNLDYIVSGSDSLNSPILEKLKLQGAQIFIGHKEENIQDNLDLVVYTAAIPKDNPELLNAQKLGIQCIDRAHFLGSVMEKYDDAIAVSGTHGKTSTTSMLSSIFNYNKLDPTILVGGNLPEIGGNVRIGNTPTFITEACEYVDSFLSLKSKYAIILNIEEDHLDYFSGLDQIISSFNKFAKLVDNGFVIGNGDDLNVRKALQDIKNVIYFGFNSNNDCVITQNEIQKGNLAFSLKLFDKYLGEFNIFVPGDHNLLNATAAIICAIKSGVDIDDARKGIASYRGVKRRFEFKGQERGIKIFDDYAHHPSEIKATLKAAKHLEKNRLIAVFQPHTFTRTLTLLDDFSNSFGDCDMVVITDIYPSREKDTGIVHSLDLVNKIIQTRDNVYYFPTFEEASTFLESTLINGDILFTMGAGDINVLGENLLNYLKN